MHKQHPHYSSHWSGADQEHISVLEIFRRGQLEDESVIYPSLSPHEDVTSVQEEMQKQ